MIHKTFLGIGMSLAVGAGVRGQLPPAPSGPDAVETGQPRLVVPERTVDLGRVVEGDRVPVVWRIENQGDADLVIERTTATCGCTVVRIDDDQRTIRPGGVLELKAYFDSKRRPGPQTKAVTVYSNAPAEPELRLRFTADVVPLYEIEPRTVLNLRAVRRGQMVDRAVEIQPGPGQQAVKIVELDSRTDGPLQYEALPIEAERGTGQQVRITVGTDVPLGAIGDNLRILLEVDGRQREHFLSIRADVVSNLFWMPKIIDATRQPSLPGKQLAPIVLKATDHEPFRLLEADAGPRLDVQTEPLGNADPPSGYRIRLTVREDAAPGPFGVHLRVLTDMVDQPVVEIPVFGIVQAWLEVDPPLIILRQDGSKVGAERRVKLQAPVIETLEVSELSCTVDGVKAEVDREASSRYRHLRFVDVTLTKPLPEGVYDGVLVVRTGMEKAPRLEVPVRVEIPADQRG